MLSPMPTGSLFPGPLISFQRRVGIYQARSHSRDRRVVQVLSKLRAWAQFSMRRRRSAPGGPQGCHRPASRAVSIVRIRDVLAHAVYCATVCATHHLRVVCGVDSGAVEEEAHAGEGLALTLTEGVHELLQLGRTLDLEEHLVVVVGDLDVQMLRLLGSFVLVARRRGRGGLGHLGGVARPFAIWWTAIKGQFSCAQDCKARCVCIL